MLALCLFSPPSLVQSPPSESWRFDPPVRPRDRDDWRIWTRTKTKAEPSHLRHEKRQSKSGDSQRIKIRNSDIDIDKDGYNGWGIKKSKKIWPKYQTRRYWTKITRSDDVRHILTFPRNGVSPQCVKRYQSTSESRDKRENTKSESAKRQEGKGQERSGDGRTDGDGQRKV